MHRPNIAVETNKSQEVDAAIHIDVERDPLELAEDAFGVWPLEAKVDGEREREDPGWVAQGQVEQENVAGAPGFQQAGVVDQSCYVSQDPHRKGKSEEKQQEVAVPFAILKLAAEQCGVVPELPRFLWVLKTGGRVSL